MKANELMCGDWVICNYYADKPCYIQFGVGDFQKLGFEFCDPVPLTKEILKDNGFRITYDGELHTTYFQDIERFHTEIRIDKVGVYQKLCMCDGLGNGIEIVECKFVHQLQHALRLCEIDKEIKL